MLVSENRVSSVDRPEPNTLFSTKSYLGLFSVITGPPNGPVLFCSLATLIRAR